MKTKMDRDAGTIRLLALAVAILLAAPGCARSDGSAGDGDTDGTDVLPDDPCLQSQAGDCDGDWLSNGLEDDLGLDPLSNDSDGDGTIDIAEVALCCEGGDPHSPACAAAVADPECGLDPDEYYVELPFGHSESRELEFGTTIQQADIYFLVDTTHSMDGEISNLRSGLSTLATILDEAIPDVRFGVGRFDDFPVDPYGASVDVVYEHLVPVTGDLGTVQAALDGLSVHNGGDYPESQVEAFYQVATGEGLTTYVPPHSGCLEDAVGRPCFRKESLPVVILCTDAQMHNGPPTGGSDAYDDGLLALGHSHTWPEAMGEVNALGIKILTIFSGVSLDRDDHVQTAEATSSVTADGDPLVFDINADGTGIGTTIVSAVAALADQVPRDVSASWLEDPAVDDGVDAAGFIASITPNRCAPDGGCSIAGDVFEDTLPGTLLFFDILFENDFVEQIESGPQIFLLRIVVLGDATARLDERRVVVLVPPTVILI